LGKKQMWEVHFLRFLHVWNYLLSLSLLTYTLEYKIHILLHALFQNCYWEI
jgi:hypothetical protein